MFEFDVISKARADLATSGAAVLPGFVPADQADAILSEVEPHLCQAFAPHKSHNVYLVEDDQGFGPDHPRNRKVTTTSATLAFDLISPGGLRDLYANSMFRDGLASILEFDELYPYADPLAGVNVLDYTSGAQTGWHFDNATFAITLMLRAAEHGGRFEYIPFLRNDTDRAFDAVEHVLAGDTSAAITLNQGPGDLVIFKGHNTLHRVTSARGRRSRVIAVFSYDPTPGRVLDAHTRRTFYGRAT